MLPQPGASRTGPDLIIAHLPNHAFEPARTELADLGVLRITISEVHSTSMLPAVTLRYRGAALETHLRTELRLECVAPEGEAPAVLDVLCAYAGRSGQVAVLDIEELHRPRAAEQVFMADPRLESAAQ